MKVKIEVKSWNNYSPLPHTHTSGVGRGPIRLTLHQVQLFMDAKLFNGTFKYQKFLLSPRINLFGLHIIAWCPWQPIGHCTCSWVICKQTQDKHLRNAHTFIDFFSLPLNHGKTSCQLLAKQNGR